VGEQPVLPQHPSTHLELRDLTPDDGPVLDAVVADLSPYSRYLRFHTGMPRLPATVRRGLLCLDGRDRIAIVAAVATAVGDQPVGIAHLARTSPGRAEVAIVVVEGWRRAGAGRRLLAELALRARSLGIDELTGIVLPENLAMIGLIRHLSPAARFRLDARVLEVRCPLDERAVEVVTHLSRATAPARG